MTNEIQQSQITEPKSIPFGNRLKSAREALGYDRKDVAAQLRLNEKIIVMMEKDRYPADLPVTFIRGYIRAYSKLLQIPEHEVKKALEPIKPKPTTHAIASTITTPTPVTSGNYFMQFFTYMIMITLIGLVGTWWYNHSTSPSPLLALSDNTLPITTPETIAPAPSSNHSGTAPSLTATPAIEAPIATTASLAPNSAPVTTATPQTTTTSSITTSAENTLDTSTKITNDTDTKTTKVAQAKKPVRAKRIVPVEEAEAQDINPADNDANAEMNTGETG